MEILEFFYDSWISIDLIGIALGIISGVIALWTYMFKKWKNQILRILISVVTVLVIVLICFGCLTNILFTKVPLVSGTTVTEAVSLLEERELNIAFEPGVTKDENLENTIMGQSIKEGALVEKETDIVVYLYNEETEVPNLEEKVIMPNLIGKEQLEATEMLTEIGLQFQVWWTAENNTESETYYIISQSIPEDTEIPSGTLVKLELSPNKP